MKCRQRFDLCIAQFGHCALRKPPPILVSTPWPRACQHARSRGEFGVILCTARDRSMAPAMARAADAVSFFEQPLHPVQVLLHKCGIGRELRVGYAGLAKQSKQQFAPAAVFEQSHGDVNALAGGA